MIIVDLDSLQISKENAIVALGNFDGMHRGHQKLFQIAVQEHRTKGITPRYYYLKRIQGKRFGRITNSCSPCRIRSKPLPDSV